MSSAAFRRRADLYREDFTDELKVWGLRRMGDGNRGGPLKGSC